MPIDVSSIREREFAGQFVTTVLAWKKFAHDVHKGTHPLGRQLRDEEILLLERGGNRSADWTAHRVVSAFGFEYIRNCTFSGQCIFAGSVGVADCVLENSRFHSCIVASGATVLDSTSLIHVVLSEGSRVLRCTRIGSEKPHSFGLGEPIAFAPGGGRRRLPVSPEVRSSELAALAVQNPESPANSEYRALVADICEAVQTEYCILAPHAAASSCGTLREVYLGHSSEAESVAFGTGIVLLGAPAASNRRSRMLAPGIVRNVVAQESCEISGGAQVDHAFMAEASWARDGAHVYSSIIAPNSGVACGELKSSFLGPFVGFSHQALCIATFWPAGKGNISYGANVGSNHSGRAADQEHFAGEGVFYGLDCAIKFPFNSMEAPYSMIASGAVCLPQKIEFPFSLINIPRYAGPEIPPGLNEIFPGWQIGHNLYGLLRSSEKYRERNRATREDIPSQVFREEMRTRIACALAALEAAIESNPAGAVPDIGAFYTESEIPGLGKNVAYRRDVEHGIHRYRFALELIEYFAGRAPRARNLIETDILGLLRLAREKDDKRGARIIPDYPDIHGSTESDALLAQWRKAIEG